MKKIFVILPFAAVSLWIAFAPWMVTSRLQTIIGRLQASCEHRCQLSVERLQTLWRNPYQVRFENLQLRGQLQTVQVDIHVPSGQLQVQSLWSLFFSPLQIGDVMLKEPLIRVTDAKGGKSIGSMRSLARISAIRFDGGKWIQPGLELPLMNGQLVHLSSDSGQNPTLQVMAQRQGAQWIVRAPLEPDTLFSRAQLTVEVMQVDAKGILIRAAFDVQDEEIKAIIADGAKQSIRRWQRQSSESMFTLLLRASREAQLL